MLTKNADRVRALPLFTSAAPETFDRLSQGAFLQRFPAGTTLLMEGDPVDFLYVILEGAVELHASWNDKDTTLSILRPVSTFILAAVILDSPALMSARTLERSEILMIPGDTLRRQAAEDNALSQAVSAEMAGCYRGLVRVIKNLKLRGGVERLANYLLTQRARQGSDRIELPHEKRVLASLIGMTPENLSRAFNTLQPYGVVVKGATVTLTKPRDLERLAKPDPLIDNHRPLTSHPVSTAEREAWPEAPLGGLN